MLIATYKNLAQGHVGHVLALTTAEAARLASGEVVHLSIGGPIGMRFYLCTAEDGADLAGAIARVAAGDQLADVRIAWQHQTEG